MSKTKSKKSTLFSRFLVTSLICGTALGFSGNAFAKDIFEPNPLFNQASNLNVFAVGGETYNVGLFADNGYTTFVGKNAISLGVSDYAVYAKVANAATAGVELELGNKAGNTTNFIVLTGKTGIYAEGIAPTGTAPDVVNHDAKVGTYGKYLGIYANDANGEGVDAEKYGTVELKSANTVIKAYSYGIHANGGNVTVAGNLFVEASSATEAIRAEAGTVEINTGNESTATTVINGKIHASNGSTVKAKLTGKDSSWTGNVASNGTSNNIEISLVDGATWNVVLSNGEHKVDTLTMDGGFIEMRDNQGGGTAAVAEVTDLKGTKGTVHMDGDDTLQVTAIGKNSNTELTIYGGKIDVGEGIYNGATVTLNDVTVVNDSLYVWGTLNGKNVKFADEKDLYVSEGTATFTGDTTTVYDVSVSGATGEGKTGTVTFGAKETYADTLTADAYGVITANGSKLIAKHIEAKNKGEVYLQGGSTSVSNTEEYGMGLTALNGGTIVVDSNLNVNAKYALRAENDGHIEINWDADGATTTNRNTTVLNGNIMSGDAPNTIKAQLTGKDSSWTGNIIDSYDSVIKIRLYDGAKWNVTSATGTSLAINTLTMNKGIVDMTQYPSAGAKVATLDGTKGYVKMDSGDKADTFAVTTITNKDLLIEGGQLAGISSTTGTTVGTDGKVTLKDLKVLDELVADGGTVNFVGTNTVNDITAANGGTVNMVGGTLNKGLADYAHISAKGTAGKVGTVNISDTADKATVLGKAGELFLVDASANGKVDINLANGDSTWYGNVTNSAGTVNVTLANAAKWTAVGGIGIAAVDTLTMNGGEISMATVGNDAAIATTLTGTKGTVTMGSGDKLYVTNLSNDELSVTNGTLVYSSGTTKVLKEDNLLLTGVTVADGSGERNSLVVQGYLDANNVTFNNGVVADGGNVDLNTGSNKVYRHAGDAEKENDGVALKATNGGEIRFMGRNDGILSGNIQVDGAKSKVDITLVRDTSSYWEGNVAGNTGNLNVTLGKDTTWKVTGAANGAVNTLSVSDGIVSMEGNDTADTAKVGTLKTATGKKATIKMGAGDAFNVTYINAENTDVQNGTLVYTSGTTGIRANDTLSLIENTTVADGSGARNAFENKGTLNTGDGTTFNNGLKNYKIVDANKTTFNRHVSGTDTPNDGVVLYNLKGGTVTADASTFNGKVENADTIITKGITALNGNVTGEGVITVQTGTTTANASVAQKVKVFTEAHYVATDAGNIDATVINAGNVDLVAGKLEQVIQGNGSVNINGDVTSDATNFDGGTVFVDDGKTLTLTGGSQGNYSSFGGQSMIVKGDTNTNYGTLQIGNYDENNENNTVIAYVNIDTDKLGTFGDYAKIVVSEESTLNLEGDFENRVVNNGILTITGDLERVSTTSGIVNLGDATVRGVVGSTIYNGGEVAKTIIYGDVKDGLVTNGGQEIAPAGGVVSIKGDLNSTDTDFDNPIDISKHSVVSNTGGTLSVIGDVNEGGIVQIKGFVDTEDNKYDAYTYILGDVDKNTFVTNDSTAATDGVALSTLEIHGDVGGALSNGYSNVTAGGIAEIYGNITSSGSIANGVNGQIQIDGNVEKGAVVTNLGKYTDNGKNPESAEFKTLTNGYMAIGGAINGTVFNSGDLYLEGDINADIHNAINDVGGHLYLGGQNLNADINGTNGTTTLGDDELKVNGNSTIQGTLYGEEGTINMAGGSTNNLTVGTLSGTINVKMDATSSSSDKITFSGAETGTVLNITSYNITSDINDNTNLTYATDNGTTGSSGTFGKVTYQLLGNSNISSGEAAMTVYTNDYIYTIKKNDDPNTTGGDPDRTAELHFARGSAGSTPVTTALQANAEAFSLTSSITTYSENINVGFSTYTAAKDLYLNGHTLKGNSTTKTNIYIKNEDDNGKYNTLNIHGGSDANDRGTIDKSIILNVSGESEVYVDGYTQIDADINLTNYGWLYTYDNTVINGNISNKDDGDFETYGTTKITGSVVNEGDAEMSFYGNTTITGSIENSTNDDGDTGMTFEGVNNVSGAITNKGVGTMEFNGENNISGTITNKNTAEITFNGDNNISGTVNNYNSGVISFNGDTDISSAINNEAEINFEGDTYISGKIENSGEMNFDSYYSSYDAYGETIINSAVTNNTSGEMNFDGVTQLKKGVTNNGTITVDGELVSDTITGSGVVVVDGYMLANGTLKQDLGVKLDDASKLEINASHLQSDVTYDGSNSNGGTVQLNGGKLKDGYTIEVAEVVLGANTTVEDVSELKIDQLSMNNNVLTLEGGKIRDGMTIVGGGVSAKIVVDGDVEAVANVLTVKVNVQDTTDTLTLTGGKLADGIVISGNGSLVTNSSSGVEARVQDIKVENGIENKQELTLTGDGALYSSIRGNGNLTVKGIVDATGKEIVQHKVTIANTGVLTADAYDLTAETNAGTVQNNGNLYLVGNDNFDMKKYISGSGTTHIGNGTEAAKLGLHANYEIDNDVVVESKANLVNNGAINGTLVVNEDAELTLNTKYKNKTAIQNAGTLNVDLANLEADVTNSITYHRDYSEDEKVKGTVNLDGSGTLKQTITGGTLYVKDSISADDNADGINHVAADVTYVKTGKVLTLTAGTLKGNFWTNTNNEGTILITKDANTESANNGKVVAEGYIDNDVTVTKNAQLTIGADNIGGKVELKEDDTNKKYGKLFLGEGTLSNEVKGGNIILQGDVVVDDGMYLKDNNFIRLGDTEVTAEKPEYTMTIVDGDLTVRIGSDKYTNGTLVIAGNTNVKAAETKGAVAQDIWTNIEVADTGALAVDVANIKQVAETVETKKTIVNDGQLALFDDGAISRAISGEGDLIIDGAMTDVNAITQDTVTIGDGDSLDMKAVLTANQITVNGAKEAGILTIDADNLKAAVDNAGILNLGKGTIDKKIAGVAYTEAITVYGTTYITGDVTSKAAISQNVVHIDKGNSLTMVGVDADLTADVKMGNNTTLTVDAWNLKGDVVSVMDDPLDDDLKSLNGTVKLGKGILEHNLKVNTVELTDNVKTTSDKINDSTNIYLEGKALVIDDTNGTLNVAIGAENHDNGTLVIVGTTDAKKKIYTDLANVGTLTVDAANIMQTTADGATLKTVANDGTLNLLGSKDEKAVDMSRVITGAGTLNISLKLNDKNAITQGTVNVLQDAEFDMDAALTADLVTNKGTMTIDADNLKAVTDNNNTLNLGNGTLNSVIADTITTANNSTLYIDGAVKSNAAITQDSVIVNDSKSLTMANDAVLTAGISNKGTLTIAAADLNGDVTNSGTVELGRADTAGTLYKKITGGAVKLTGNVATDGTNLVNGTDNDLTVDLNGQNLYITDGGVTADYGKGKLDVAVNDTGATKGALVVLGKTTASKDISAAVGVGTTGEFTVNADKLTGSNSVVNYGALTLTGGSFAREIEGTGTTTINGKVTANDYIWQNKVVVANDAELTMNDVLLANVNIVGKTETAEAGILTIGADNLKGAVANEGVLNLGDGTYTDVDENYAGFVASINGNGTTNIDGTVTTERKIVQKVINVLADKTFNVAVGTTVKTTSVDGTNVHDRAEMNVRADDIKGYVKNYGGTINIAAGDLNLEGEATLANDAAGVVNIGDSTGAKDTQVNSVISNDGVVNIYGTKATSEGAIITIPNSTMLNAVINNTGTVNTYGAVEMTSAFTGHTGTVYVNNGTFKFNNTTPGSFDNNAVIAVGAKLDPNADVFANDVTVTDYGTLVISDAGTLGADVIVDGTNAEMALKAGKINLGETGSITQTNNSKMVAEGAVTPLTMDAIVTGVNDADQLNVGGGILSIPGASGYAAEKNDQFDLVQGTAVKDVVGQDLLINNKLWKSVEIGSNVSNIDDKKAGTGKTTYVTDYFLDKDNPNTIIAEVRTIKSIDEINTNGLAGVQQGALAMTNQMNDKVADNMSLVARPAAEKGKKYDKQIWASYINTKEDLNDRELWNLKADNTAKYKGAIVGVDFYSSKKAIAGIALSYATGDITANTANRTHVQNDAKYYGVTLYDRVTNGKVAWTYDLGYQNGKNEISMNARENITADVKTNAYTAGIRVERAYEAGKNSVFAPFASVRYTRLNTGDYTNSNKSKFDSNSQNLFIPKVGLAWKGNYGDSVKGWAFNPVLEVGYMFNAGSRTAETKYLSETNHMFNAEYDIVDSGTYYGRVGMNFVNNRFSFGVDYRYLKGSTTKNSRWNVNLGYTF